MAESSVDLIVGLGNPGSGYEKTRHNAGFWCIDELARRYNAVFQMERRFHGATASLHIEGRRCHLLKPNTYMNRSGQAVQAMTHYYKIPMEKVLVIHDDLDLAPGVARLKRGGGHGGHNGLRDIVNACGGNGGFLRLRLGIGHPGNRDEVINYVLEKPIADERNAIETVIDSALDTVPQIMAGELEQVMNRLHSKS